MKFLIGFKKNGKALLKIKFDDGAEKWAVTTDAVVEYAQKNFQKEEDAVFEMTEKNGQYTVSKITKVGGSSGTTSAPATTTGTPKCSDCGKDLKDAKYKKCYDCNKANPTKHEEKPAGGGRTDAVGTSIEKQAMMKASANAVALAMQGQVQDVGVLGDLIVALYERLYAKLTA